MGELMLKFFAPAVRLMNALKYAVKFGLIGALTVLAISILVFQLVANNSETIEFSAKEIMGVDYLVPLSSLRQAVQHFALEPSTQQRAQISSAVAAVDALDQRVGSALGLSKQWQASRIRLQDLVASDQSADTATLAALDDALAKLVIDVNDNSNLTLDPDIDTYYLMDTVSTKLPAMAVAAARIGTAAAATAASSPDLIRLQLAVSEAQIKQTFSAIGGNMDKYRALNPSRANAVIKPYAAVAKAATEMEAIAHEALHGPADTARTRALLDAKLAVIDSSYELDKAILPELGRLIQMRVAKHQAAMRTDLSISLGFTLILLYLMIGASIGVIGTVHHLADAAGRFSAGDYDARVTIATRDDMQVIASAFNRLVENLATIIRQLQAENTARQHVEQELTRHRDHLEMLVSERTSDLLEQKLEVELGNRNLALLGEIGRDITALLDVSDVFLALRRHAHQLLDARSFEIFFLDAKQANLVSAYGIVEDKAQRSESFGINDPVHPAAYCARHRSDLLVDIAPDQIYPSPVPGAHGIRSAMFTPLLIGERLLGIMTVQSPQRFAYSEREQSMFRTLCAYAAIAIGNADACRRLHEALDGLQAAEQRLVRQNEAMQEAMKEARQLDRAK